MSVAQVFWRKIPGCFKEALLFQNPARNDQSWLIEISKFLYYYDNETTPAAAQQRFDAGKRFKKRHG